MSRGNETQREKIDISSLNPAVTKTLETRWFTNKGCCPRSTPCPCRSHSEEVSNPARVFIVPNTQNSGSSRFATWFLRSTSDRTASLWGSLLSFWAPFGEIFCESRARTKFHDSSLPSCPLPHAFSAVFNRGCAYKIWRTSPKVVRPRQCTEYVNGHGGQAMSQSLSELVWNGNQSWGSTRYSIIVIVILIECAVNQLVLQNT